MDLMKSKPVFGREHEFTRLVKILLTGPSQEREQAVKTAVETFETSPKLLTKNELRAILRIAITDSDNFVRDEATQAIGFYGTSKDSICLKDRQKDEDWVIRASAASALASMLGKKARRFLLPALSDENPVVRRYAVIALHDALGTDAIPILRLHYKTEEDESALFGYASAFAKEGDAEALVRLKEFAESTNRQLSSPAIESLKEIEEKAVNPLD